MAVKPGDTVINLTKPYMELQPNYWFNFTKHCEKDIDWTAHRNHDPRVEHIKREIKKYGGEYKLTKDFEEIIKFKKPSDYTFFVLKWS